MIRNKGHNKLPKTGHYRSASETPSDSGPRLDAGWESCGNHSTPNMGILFKKNITALTCLKEIKDCIFSVSISYVDYAKKMNFHVMCDVKLVYVLLLS